VSLPKIALEEAFLGPDEVRRILDDDELLERTSAGGGVTPGFYRPVMARLAEFDEVRLGDMDDNGIEHTVLSLTAPGVQRLTDMARATAEARRLNDFLAEQIARHPDRYTGFAAVALQDPDGAAAELERAVTALGLRGALVNGYTNVGDTRHGAYLDDPAFHGFWEAVQDLDVPVYLHPRTALPDGQVAYDGHPELVGATWGFGTETATHTLRMIFSGLFDRFPRLKLILGHLGEGLPALLWRTQYNFNRNPFDKKIDKTLPEYFADNIWLTTSGNFSDQALINAILTVGADHIMFSVDYPYADNALACRWIESAPISENDRRKIAHGNARRMFGIP
jgi:2,3-dihydroxybenzoate decarboxylase